jgi:putative heme-binding domain-containing protein
MPVEYAKKPLEELLNKMSAGLLSPDLYFELGEAIDSTHTPEVIAHYKSISEKLSPDELTASYAGSLLGGDAAHGKYIFFANQNAQCMKCHAYDDRGGNAGPRLNGIASRISRPQILEALINPSARLSPGYGIVTLEFKDGKILSGILQAEDNNSLTLKIGNQPNQVIRKKELAKRTNSRSSMPEMKFILSKKEIRDVVSFLATLKENN